jgi:hypothetical protein
MKSRVVLLVTALCVIPVPLSAQTAAKFEVASIKPAPTALEMMRAGTFAPPGPAFSGTRVTIARMAMRELIANAYGIDVQKVTGPSWIIEKNFAIQATMPEGASKDQFPRMLRSLLEDRFHLSANPARQTCPLSPRSRPDCLERRPQNETGRRTRSLRLRSMARHSCLSWRENLYSAAQF